MYLLYTCSHAVPMSGPGTGAWGGQRSVDLADVLHAGQGGPHTPVTAGHHASQAGVVDDDESVRFPSCTAAIRCRSGACLLAQLTLPACLLSQSCPARLTMLGPAPTGCTVHCTLYCTVHCSLQTPHTHRNHTMILWVM